MITLRISAAALAAALALSASVVPASAECKLIGGIGNGITEDVAKFMADKALQNVMDNKGMKPSGEIKHVCKSATLGTECTARQQGCK